MFQDKNLKSIYENCTRNIYNPGELNQKKKYIFIIKIKIKEVSNTIFYSCFVKEFMKIMNFKNSLHENISKNGGLYISHFIDTGMIQFYYKIDYDMINKLKLVEMDNYNCFELECLIEEERGE